MLNRISTLILIFGLAGCGATAPPYVKEQPRWSLWHGTVAPCFEKLDNGTVLEKPCPSEKTAGKEGAVASSATEGRKHKAWRHCNEELCRQDCPEGEDIIWAKGPDGILRHGSASCTCEAVDCGTAPSWGS